MVSQKWWHFKERPERSEIVRLQEEGIVSEEAWREHVVGIFQKQWGDQVTWESGRRGGREDWGMGEIG